MVTAGGRCASALVPRAWPASAGTLLPADVAHRGRVVNDRVPHHHLVEHVRVLPEARRTEAHTREWQTCLAALSAVACGLRSCARSQPVRGSSPVWQSRRGLG